MSTSTVAYMKSVTPQYTAGPRDCGNTLEFEKLAERSLWRVARNERVQRQSGPKCTTRLTRLEFGMTYRPPGPRLRSFRSTRGSHDPPRSQGKPDTGEREAGLAESQGIERRTRDAGNKHYPGTHSRKRQKGTASGTSVSAHVQ